MFCRHTASGLSFIPGYNVCSVIAKGEKMFQSKAQAIFLFLFVFSLQSKTVLGTHGSATSTLTGVVRAVVGAEPRRPRAVLNRELLRDKLDHFRTAAQSDDTKSTLLNDLKFELERKGTNEFDLTCMRYGENKDPEQFSAVVSIESGKLSIHSNSQGYLDYEQGDEGELTLNNAPQLGARKRESNELKAVKGPPDVDKVVTGAWQYEVGRDRFSKPIYRTENIYKTTRVTPYVVKDGNDYLFYLERSVYDYYSHRGSDHTFLCW